MKNFSFWNPTKIFFGKGQTESLAKLYKDSDNILVTIGGGSVKKNGVLAQVESALQGKKWTLFEGIEPNPRYETLMKAVALCREKGITEILAVGGGSVADGSKFIAAAAVHSGQDPWDFLAKGQPVTNALPLGVVLTLSATGSESNGYSVVSRGEPFHQKRAFGSEKMIPRFAILDPEFTKTLPKSQIINGIVDPFVHVTEQFLTKEMDTPLQDRFACSILSVLVQEGPRALTHPDDLAPRSHLMWCATQALNGLSAVGCVEDWATHMIGHELTNRYGVDHGASLALVHPALLRHQLPHKKDKLAIFGQLVWNLSGAPEKVAALAIDKTEDFFRRLGAKTRLSECEIPRSDIPKIADAIMAVMKEPFGENGHIGRKEIIEILEAAH